MNNEPMPQSEILLYQTEDGRTRIQCRFENETLWLTQKLLAELFQIGVNTVNHHLKEIFSESELRAESTIRRYRIVQTEGSRQIAREVEHYNLEAILAVGYRVRSHRGTQFRQWATAELEYDRYRTQIDGQPRQVDRDFEEAVKLVGKHPKPGRLRILKS